MNTTSWWKRASLAMVGGLVLLGAFGSPASADGPATNEPPKVPDAGNVIPESGSSVINSQYPEAAGLTISVIKDPQPRPSIFTDNYAPLIVTIQKDGQPTTVDYEVFAIGRHDDGGGKIAASDTYTCLERSYTSPDTPRGVFWCTVITDHGGDWTFTAYVNKFRRDPKAEVPVNLGQASVLAPVSGGTLEGAGKVKNNVKAEGFEIGILAIHSVFAAGWFTCIGVLVLLSMAGGRRLLSARGTHIVEAKLDRIITGAKAFTICVTGTGIYMLFRMTAYDTPSSPDKFDQVFDLPYGRPYFLALFLKIGVYAALVGFSFVLIKESKRRSTQLIEPGRRRTAERDVDPTDIWSQPWDADKRPSGKRGTATTTSTTMVEEEVTVETATPEATVEGAQEVTIEPTRRGVRVASLAMLAGAGTIMLCVTLLKYFHELIEAARVVTGAGG